MRPIGVEDVLAMGPGMELRVGDHTKIRRIAARTLEGFYATTSLGGMTEFLAVYSEDPGVVAFGLTTSSAAAKIAVATTAALLSEAVSVAAREAGLPTGGAILAPNFAFFHSGRMPEDFVGGLSYYTEMVRALLDGLGAGFGPTAVGALDADRDVLWLPPAGELDAWTELAEGVVSRALRFVSGEGNRIHPLAFSERVITGVHLSDATGGAPPTSWRAGFLFRGVPLSGSKFLGGVHPSLARPGDYLSTIESLAIAAHDLGWGASLSVGWVSGRPISIALREVDFEVVPPEEILGFLEDAAVRGTVLPVNAAPVLAALGPEQVVQTTTSSLFKFRDFSACVLYRKTTVVFADDAALARALISTEWREAELPPPQAWSDDPAATFRLGERDRDPRRPLSVISDWWWLGEEKFSAPPSVRGILEVAVDADA